VAQAAAEVAVAAGFTVRPAAVVAAVVAWAGPHRRSRRHRNESTRGSVTRR